MKPANFAPIYCCLYPQLAEVARLHGYALAVHGSMARDGDFVCIPWAKKVNEPAEVIASILSRYALKQIGEPEEMNHGRVNYTLSLGMGECFLDFSFMPPPTGEQK